MDGFSLSPTNSFIAGDLEILKLDAVDDPGTDPLKVDDINMEESYFSKAIKYLASMNEGYTQSKINLFKSIMESTGTSYILESFSDYYVQVEAIIAKFLAFLEARLDEFDADMDRLVEGNTVIASHRTALMEEIKYYDDDNTEGYNYTIDDSHPNYSILDKFNATLFDELFKPMISDLSVEHVNNIVTSMELESDYRKFRGSLLGTDAELSDDGFIKELYKTFRNGDNSVTELSIDAVEIRNIAEKWFGYREMKSLMRREFNTLRTSYEGILKKVAAVCKDNNSLTVGAFTNLLPADVQLEKIDGKAIDSAGAKMSPDLMVQIDIYTKAKLDQLQKYTDICCMAFTAKLDAIKLQFAQYQRILMAAVEVLDKPDCYYDARTNPIKTVDDTKMPTELEREEGL